MGQSSKVVFINHSRILFIPVVGTLFYKLQYFLYKQGFINSLRISRKFNSERIRLLKLISEKAKYTICRSYKLGTALKDLENEIIADFNAPKDLKKKPLEKIYDLSWTLVFSKSVTPATKKSLGGFLPKDFPETKIIVLPYHDRPDVICDFVFQTAKELARRGSIVFLIPFFGSKSIFKFFLKSQNHIKTLEDRFKGYENITIYQPFSLLPLRLDRFELVKSVNQFFSTLHTSFLIRSLNKPVLWGFDWRDSEILGINRGFCLCLYDCVDYWTSLDKNRAQLVKNREKYLIKYSDYFFVNSISLFNAKKNIRKADAVVPQGFDADSFSSKKPLGKNETKEIILYKTLFRQIGKPIVGFVGSLSYRIDFELLNNVISLLPETSFVFTGSIEATEDDKLREDLASKINKVKNHPNAYFIPKTQNRYIVKEIIKNFDIGIIPYDISFEFNRYCYPMKLFEYFYMEKPVISTPIEELRRFPKYVKTGKNAKEWQGLINTTLSESWPKKYKFDQKKLARENSWRKKIEIISEVYDNYSASE